MPRSLAPRGLRDRRSRSRTSGSDFESRSSLPITHGTYRYATSADAIVLAYAIGPE